MEKIRQNRHRIALFSILLLSGFFSFYGAWNEGYSNWYYASAVKSMLQSWHNFFFASFDPGGFISVDKPPLGLWLQTLSARIFGFHGWSLILPGSLSTVISVALLYHLVQRSFGRLAGLLAALILALTPILNAVSRINNLDAPLIMTLLFAAWALLAAAEKGSFPLCLLSMALVGLAYNIKMLEAFLVLPAFYLVYLFLAPVKLSRRLLHLAGATLVLVAVSLSWSVAVDLTPADQRPYMGGSKTNSAIELALGYNGVQRIFGLARTSVPPGGANRAPAGPNGSNMQDGRRSSANGPAQAMERNPAGSMDPAAGADGNPGAVPGNRPGGNPGFNPGGGSDGRSGGNPGSGAGRDSGVRPGGGFARGSGSVGLWTGQQGLFRMFNRELGGQIGWLIPLALSGILLGLLSRRSPVARCKKQALCSVLLWGLWLAAMYACFSISSFYHPYYTSIMAPGIAALAAVGLVEMWRAYWDGGWKSWLLPAVLTINAGVQAVILSGYAPWGSHLIPFICGINAAAALLLAGLKLFGKSLRSRWAGLLAVAGFAALLAAPALWSSTPILYGIGNKTLPYTGPDLPGTPDVVISRPEDGYSDLTKFLLSKRQDEKYLIAVPKAIDAAPIILETGLPVMAVGGFMGSDSPVTAAALEAMVNAGEIRYFLLGNGMSSSEAARWVLAHGRAVSPEDTKGQIGNVRQSATAPGSGSTSGILYDLTPEKDAG